MHWFIWHKFQWAMWNGGGGVRWRTISKKYTVIYQGVGKGTMFYKHIHTHSNTWTSYQTTVKDIQPLSFSFSPFFLSPNRIIIHERKFFIKSINPLYIVLMGLHREARKNNFLDENSIKCGILCICTYF